MDADRLFYLRPKGALFHPLPPLHDRLTGGDPHTNHNHLSLTARSRKAERKRASGESKGVIGYGGLPPEGSRSWLGVVRREEKVRRVCRGATDRLVPLPAVRIWQRHIFYSMMGFPLFF